MENNKNLNMCLVHENNTHYWHDIVVKHGGPDVIDIQKHVVNFNRFFTVIYANEREYSKI